jgi:hypothetical protein
MNTPEPCDKCFNLYWDVMQEDDPSYSAECKLGLLMGNMDCEEFYPCDISSYMSLKKYIEKVKKDLEYFESYWKEQYKIEPNLWPMVLDKDEWKEEFNNYIKFQLNGI